MRNSRLTTLALLMLTLQLAVPGHCYFNKRMSFPLASSHSNFVRSNYYRDTISARSSRDEVRCKSGMCTDANATCCFNRVCKATKSDVSNCGTCGNACGYGHACCGGRCVDLLRDTRHCGNCGSRCGHRIACEMGICGYAAGEDVDEDQQEDVEEQHKARFPKQW